MLNSRLDLPSLPSCPVSCSMPTRLVFQDPVESVALVRDSASRTLDFRSTLPPNVACPTVEAPPGLRSTTAPPRNWLGKKTQEWWLTPLVSLNGMPSKLKTVLLSERPRMVILASPRPMPLGETVKTPGVIVRACV